jgi:O-antigen/teichoic acid export membrane protein
VTPDAADRERSGPPSLFVAALATYGTNVAVAVLSLANVLITARGLGPTGRGEVAFLTTVGFLTAQCATLGIQQANANLASRRPALTATLIANSVVFSVALGAVTAGIVALLAVALPSFAEVTSATLLALVLASVPMLVLQAALQQLALAHHLFRESNWAWVLVPATTCGVNGVLALAGILTVGVAAGAWVAGQALATIILWRALATRAPGSRRPEAALGREMLSFGMKAQAGRVLLLGNYRLDQWILGPVSGAHALGIYSVAVAWAEALFFLPTALTMVLQPSLARATPEAAGRQAARAFRLTMLTTAALAVLLVAAAPMLCAGVFGESFRPAAGQLRILAVGGFGIVALKLFGTALTAQQRPLRETAAIAVAFVVVIGLDVLLIPTHAGTGAAIASAIGYSAGGVAVVAIFRRTLPIARGALVPRAGDLQHLLHQVGALARRLLRAA